MVAARAPTTATTIHARDSRSAREEDDDDPTGEERAAAPRAPTFPDALRNEEEDIRSWLDSLKQGWAARFAAAFEAVGVEDTSDLIGFGGQAAAELMKELSEHGAKSLHVQRIMAAIEATTKEARATQARLEVLSGVGAAGGDRAAKVEGRRFSLGTTLQKDFLSSKEPEALPPAAGEKKFLAFLSHHKSACSMEARFIKEELERMVPGASIFLDSDDLKDLRALLTHVRNSACLVILQSENVLERPYCLLEIYAAIEAGVPIVALNVIGKGYDFARAVTLLTHLDHPSTMEASNPGASKLVEREAGTDLQAVAHALAQTVPNVISVNFDSFGTRNAIHAALLDLLSAMKAAKAIPFAASCQEWLAARGEPTPPAAAEHAHGQGGAEAEGVRGARLPAELPQVPTGYLPRTDVVDSCKAALNARRRRVSVHGMGGSGKTVVASALARESFVVSAFDTIVYVPLGQTPVMLDVHAAMCRQLGGAKGALQGTTEEVRRALCDLAAGRRVFLVLDDAWSREVVEALDVLDARTESCLLVTTRHAVPPYHASSVRG